MHESFHRLSEFTDQEQLDYEEGYQNLIKNGISGFKIQEPFKEVNDYGLYFNEGYLDELGKAILMLPIEKMALYKDVVTESLVEVDDLDHFKLLAFEFDIEKDYQTCNTTGIGNMAYVIMNAKDEEVVNNITEVLNKLYLKYKGELLNALNEVL